jgi:hypothetical protein
VKGDQKEYGDVTLDLTFEQWSWIASITAGLLALFGFPLIFWQLLVARKQRADAVRLSTSQVVLAADGVLTAHAEINKNLRPGGEWEKDSDNRPNEDEMPSVEPYLGVFERIFIAVKAGQLEDEVVYNLYGYRLKNIWANDRLVKEKLQNEKVRHYWKRLIALTYVVEAYLGKRLEGHTDNYFPSEVFDRRLTKRVREGLGRSN